MKIENGIDVMLGAYIDDTVEMLKARFLENAGIQIIYTLVRKKTSIMK